MIMSDEITTDKFERYECGACNEQMNVAGSARNAITCPSCGGEMKKE